MDPTNGMIGMPSQENGSEEDAVTGEETKRVAFVCFWPFLT